MSRHTRRVSQIMEVKDLEYLTNEISGRKTILNDASKLSIDVTLQSGMMLNHCILYRELTFDAPPKKDFSYSKDRANDTAFVLNVVDNCKILEDHVTFSSAISTVENTINRDPSEVVWIHVSDREVLPLIFAKFNVHPVAVTTFYDNLPRTTFNFIDADTFLFSMTTFCLQESDGVICTIKLYLYRSKNVLITQERRSHAALKEVSISRTPNQDNSSKSKVAPGSLGKSASSVQENEILNVSTINPQNSMRVFRGRAYAALRVAINDERILSAIDTFGSVYICYIAMREMIYLTTPVINFYSIQQLKLHDSIHVRDSQPTHSEGNAILDKIDFIKSGFQLMENLVDRCAKGLTNVEDKITEYIPPELIVDLIHEYAYTYDVITDMDKELDRLTETVNGIISRRNEQISIVLSLVATVFLPLTFIAGVFGMNFSNGGILVHVLHMNNGTTVFWISCVICVLYCFSVFIAKGWMDMLGKVRRGGHSTASSQQQTDSQLFERLKFWENR